MTKLKIKDFCINTVVFDFDGTLAKLNIDFNHMRDTILHLISSYGIAENELQADFVLEMINESKIILEQNSPQKAETFKAEALRVIEIEEINAARKGELFAKTKELLNHLKLHEISSGVITRNCAKAISIVFPDMSSYCDAIVCRDMVKNVKPHPEHLDKVLQMLHSLPSHTLMIGDHPLDIQTGRNAGTRTAGVLTGKFQKSDFLYAGADLVLSQASDLLYMIN
jgi:phosphoglycolate phosphatase